MKPPVIVIGMHRSGTSLLAEILGRFGVFMGHKVSGHNESIFFLRANQYLYNISHARWDYPNPVNCLVRELGDKAFRDQFLTFFKDNLMAKVHGEYWGGPNERDFWGWKDPRNTFTLPIWKLLYPEMKVLHIYRNGVDVAASLQVREQSRGGKFGNHTFSCRCMDLQGGFDLWTEYESQCRQVLEEIPQDDQLTLCYENLLTEPTEAFMQLENFLRVPMDKIRDVVSVLASSVDPNNAFKFTRNNRLNEYYQSVKAHPLMKSLGYGFI